MSNSGISFTGIQSGVDTASIVEQLMAIEARPKVLLQQQQALVEFRKKFFGDISAKLTSLRGLSDGLRNSLGLCRLAVRRLERPEADDGRRRPRRRGRHVRDRDRPAGPRERAADDRHDRHLRVRPGGLRRRRHLRLREHAPDGPDRRRGHLARLRGGRHGHAQRHEGRRAGQRHVQRHGHLDARGSAQLHADEHAGRERHARAGRQAQGREPAGRRAGLHLDLALGRPGQRRADAGRDGLDEGRRLRLLRHRLGWRRDPHRRHGRADHGRRGQEPSTTRTARSSPARRTACCASPRARRAAHPRSRSRRAAARPRSAWARSWRRRTPR